MKRFLCVMAFLALGLGLSARSASADTITWNFDSLLEFDTPGLLDGATFTAAQVLTAGTSLNEFEFPPHSGNNVVYNILNTMRLDFSDVADSFGGYFTYLGPLTVTAFGTGGVMLGSASSLFSANFATSGNPANELIQITAAGISYVEITAALGAGTFVMDDAFVTNGGVTPVPEPSTLALLGIGIVSFTARRFKKRPTAEWKT